jgi:hypothetical protein
MLTEMVVIDGTVVLLILVVTFVETWVMILNAEIINFDIKVRFYE